MNKKDFFFAVLIIFCFKGFGTIGQTVENDHLVWEKNIIDIGAVLEEKGEVTAEYFFINKADFPVYIEEVITDCGCTTADYTKDTLFQDKKGSVKITFNPQLRGGVFSKMILVKTNIDTDGDSLFLEGINIPLPRNINQHYSVVKEGLGFKSSTVNMGNVFTNEPKTKYIDFYNFNDSPIQLNQIQLNLPGHIRAKFIPEVVKPDTRAVLELEYDAAIKDDLGFFEEEFSVSALTFERKNIPFKLLAIIHEHFDPVSLHELENLPKLEIKDAEVDLEKIKDNNPVSKSLSLENVGTKPLNIRKIVTNCDCLTFDLPKNDIMAGETVDLTFTFDPKGRRGIDHKTLTIFSNDPLNPTRTVMIKSRIN